MIPLEKPTINRPSRTVFPVHFFKKKGILTYISSNFENTLPQIFELSVLAFLFIPCIPLWHHIIQLKFVRFSFSIIDFIYLLLQLGCVLKNFFSCLLQVDHLIQPSLHGIFLTACLLKKTDHQGSKVGWEYCVYSINQLKL